MTGTCPGTFLFVLLASTGAPFPRVCFYTEVFDMFIQPITSVTQDRYYIMNG